MIYNTAKQKEVKEISLLSCQHTTIWIKKPVCLFFS